MKILAALFSFKGRMDRRDFWLIQLLLLVLSIVAAIWSVEHVIADLGAMNFDTLNADALDQELSAAVASSLAPTGTGFLGLSVSDWIITALLTWPFLATQVKRFHDIDHSGWWILLNLIPLLGSLAASIMTGFLPGTKGPNRYGPDPSAGGLHAAGNPADAGEQRLK